MNAPFISGAKYSWTGPNGFSSNLRNPKIGDASSLNNGLYKLELRRACCLDTSSVYVELNYDTIYSEEQISFCNWDNTILDGYNRCAKYMLCNRTFEIKEHPLIGNEIISFDPSEKSICLSEGIYIIKCFDYTTCKLRITTLFVNADTPTLNILKDTISYCDWSAFPIGNIPNGAKYNACNKNIPHYISDDPETFILNDQSYDYIIQEGDWIVNCFDTTSCQINKTYLHVYKSYPSLAISYDTLYFCDYRNFSQLPANITNNSVNITPCNENSLISVYDKINVGMLLYPTGTVNFNLPEGEYLITCYDTSACIYYERNISILPNTPIQNIQNDTFYFCKIIDSNFVSYQNMFEYLQCDKLNSMYIETNATPPLSNFYITNNNLEYKTYFLAEGNYIDYCFDTTNCSYDTKYITVIANNATETVQYDTFFACDWSSEGLPNNHYLLYPNTEYHYVLYEPGTNNEYFIPNENGSYLLPIGNSKARFFDENICQITTHYINVQPLQPNHIVLYDTVQYCDWPNHTVPNLDFIPGIIYNPGCDFSIKNIEQLDPLSLVLEIENNQYYLNKGDYIITCWDTLNCTKYTKHVNVKVHTGGIDRIYDTLTICDWSDYNILTKNNVDYYIPGKYHNFKDANSNVNMFSNNGMYQLAVGDYFSEEYNYEICRRIRRYIHVKYENPIIEILYDTISFCGLDYSINIDLDTICNESLIKKISTASSNSEIFHLGDSRYSLNNGTFDVDCIDTNSCIVNRINLTVLKTNIDSLISYDTVYICEEDYYTLISIENTPYYVTTYNGSVLFTANPYVTQFTLGDYLIEKYNTTSCNYIANYLNVQRISQIDTFIFTINVGCNSSFNLDAIQGCEDRGFTLWSNEEKTLYFIENNIYLKNNTTIIGENFTFNGCLKCVNIVHFVIDTVEYNTQHCWASLFTPKCSPLNQKITDNETGEILDFYPSIFTNYVNINKVFKKNYTITGTDSNGCACKEFIEVSLLRSDTSEICINSNYNLLGICPNNSTYNLWLTNNGIFSPSNIIMVNPSNTYATFFCHDSMDCPLLQYHVKIKTPPSCNNLTPPGFSVQRILNDSKNTEPFKTKEFQFVDDISGNNSIKKDLKTESIKLYPNPFSNMIFIENKDALKNSLTILISDSKGQIIKDIKLEYKYEDEIKSILLDNVADGLYFIHIKEFDLNYKFNKISY